MTHEGAGLTAKNSTHGKLGISSIGHAQVMQGKPGIAYIAATLCMQQTSILHSI